MRTKQCAAHRAGAARPMISDCICANTETDMTLYRTIFPIPIVCFLAALVSDIGYASSANLQYLHFSEWLIAAGLAIGALAALVLLVLVIARSAMRTRPGWMHLVLFYATLALELVNSLVHTIDGWTAVVWNGMMLSVVGAILALAAAATLRAAPLAWTGHREVRA
jgi:uncharacterized membrane protein